GELAVVVEIPPDFGRDLTNLRSPEVAFWIDGAMPFRGETAKGYVTGLTLRYAQDLAVERLGPNAPSNAYLGGLTIENRFRYNQAFKSVFAMIPSTVVMILVLIPAIMASIAVVREKETGSIANFRSTPISKFEFLSGKQIAYVAVGMVTFGILLPMAFLVLACRSKDLSERWRSGRCSTFSRLAVSGNSCRPSHGHRWRLCLPPQF